MNKSFRIEIPEPCNKRWEEMTPGGQGRYCDRCNKTVTDFSVYSDAELHRFFTKPQEGVCGRFATRQLGRVLHQPYQPQSRLYSIAAALGLIILAAGYPARKSYAQPPMAQTRLMGDTVAVAGSGTALSGNIATEGGSPLEKAVVAAYAGSVCTAITSTDKAGDFSLNIEPGHYTVKVSFVGMDTVQRTMEVLAQHNTHMTATLQKTPQPIVTVTETFTAGGPMISYRDLASITTARYLSAKPVKHKVYKKVKKKSTHKKRRR